MRSLRFTGETCPSCNTRERGGKFSPDPIHISCEFPPSGKKPLTFPAGRYLPAEKQEVSMGMPALAADVGPARQVIISKTITTVITANKGGVGKTTLSFSLAVAAAYDGYKLD
jgi:Mrp family chromosome partitioning ATPase